MHHRSRTLRALLAVAVLAVLGLVAQPAAAKNTAKQAKRGASADLVVQGLEVDYLGDTLQAVADLRNLGRATAGRSDVVVAISADSRLDRGDQILERRSVPALKAGKTRELDMETDIPADEDLPAGTVWLLVCADAKGAVRESDESNNCASTVIADALSYDDDDVSSVEDAVVDVEG